MCVCVYVCTDLKNSSNRNSLDQKKDADWECDGGTPLLNMCVRVCGWMLGKYAPFNTAFLHISPHGVCNKRIATCADTIGLKCKY